MERLDLNKLEPVPKRAVWTPPGLETLPGDLAERRAAFPGEDEQYYIGFWGIENTIHQWREKLFAVWRDPAADSWVLTYRGRQCEGEPNRTHWDILYDGDLSEKEMERAVEELLGVFLEGDKKECAEYGCHPEPTCDGTLHVPAHCYGPEALEKLRTCGHFYFEAQEPVN